MKARKSMNDIQQALADGAATIPQMADYPRPGESEQTVGQGCSQVQFGYNDLLYPAIVGAREDANMWCEDFDDEPSVEERMPFGVSPEEMRAVSEEAMPSDCCEFCKLPSDDGELVETGMYEYYTMDLDPGTRVCPECLESHRMLFIPDDPSLFDCYTPLACV